MAQPMRRDSEKSAEARLLRMVQSDLPRDRNRASRRARRTEASVATARLASRVGRHADRRGESDGRDGTLDLESPSLCTPSLEAYIADYRVSTDLLGADYVKARMALERDLVRANDDLNEAQARGASGNDATDHDAWVAKTIGFQIDAARRRVRDAEVGLKAVDDIFHLQAEAVRDLCRATMSHYKAGLVRVRARGSHERGLLEGFPLPDPPRPSWCRVCFPLGAEPVR